MDEEIDLDNISREKLAAELASEENSDFMQNDDSNFLPDYDSDDNGNCDKETGAHEERQQLTKVGIFINLGHAYLINQGSHIY